MYPLYHHFGFKCIISFFMFAEYSNRNAYRNAKLNLLKNQNNTKSI